MQIQAAFNTFQINPLDVQVGNSFTYQCELYPPEGFLNFLTQQLTADGMLPLLPLPSTASQCNLVPGFSEALGHDSLVYASGSLAKSSSKFYCAPSNRECLHSPGLRLLPASVTGSCGFPTQCTLDPNAGVAQAVDWSRPAALQYFKGFILDTVQTVQLTSACAAMSQ